MADFALDLRRSSEVFRDLVWPECRAHLDGGALMQMEDRPDAELATQLDMKAGIDGWQVHERGMRGIASRVQIVEPPAPAWNTFTVRRARDSGAVTEYEKRRDAVESGRWVYPHVTIQAYVETWDGPVVSVGIARTADIVAFIGLGLAKTRRTSNASFYVVPWGALRDAGYMVKVLKARPPLTSATARA